MILGKRPALIVIMLLAGVLAATSGADEWVPAPAAMSGGQSGSDTTTVDSSETLLASIGEIEECAERRYVVLQILCAMSTESPHEDAAELGDALLMLLETEAWQFDATERPDLAFARESLRDVLAYLDQGEIAIRLALDSGFPGLAISIFLEHYDPACAELFILCDAAREAAEIPEQ